MINYRHSTAGISIVVLLLLGSWSFCVAQQTYETEGDLDFGKTVVMNLREIHAQWFDYCLKGEHPYFLNYCPISRQYLRRPSLERNGLLPDTVLATIISEHSWEGLFERPV
jgi:hypothetical protein